MSQTRQRVRPLAVGVDLGGTWIRVVILRDGRATRRVKRVSRMPELDKVLPNVLESRRRVRSLVVAARGVWTAAERAALRRRLRGLAERVEVISDVEAALLGALGSRPGVLVLAGTGSIVLGRDGHGRLARALARRPDAIARIAALAPAVLARARGGHRRARGIVAAGQEHLAALAAGVIRRLGLAAPVVVSWSGSLLGDDWYRAGLRRALARRARCQWRPPEADPALAAARLAARLA